MSEACTRAPPRLTIDGLCVSAGGRRLLEGVREELDEGERVAMVGPSGCGKTTLLRSLAALEDPDGGRVLLDGEEPGARGWPRFRGRVVLVAQAPVMTAGSVWENLAAPHRYAAHDDELDQDRAGELLARLDLEEFAEQEARRLSVGQQQRVSLARALLVSPRVLLLDEPTSGLDRVNVDRVAEVLAAETAATGLAALVSTHDLGLAERLCSRRLDLAGYRPVAEAA